MRIRNKLLLGLSSLTLLAGAAAFASLNKNEAKVANAAAVVEGDIGFEIDSSINTELNVSDPNACFGLLFEDGDYNTEWADSIFSIDPIVSRAMIHYSLNLYPEYVRVVYFDYDETGTFDPAAWTKAYEVQSNDRLLNRITFSYDNDQDAIIDINEINDTGTTLRNLSDDLTDCNIYDGMDNYLASLPTFDYVQFDRNQNGEFGFSASYTFLEDSVFYVSSYDNELTNYPKIKGIFDYKEIEDTGYFVCNIPGTYKVVYTGDVIIVSDGIEAANDFADYFNENVNCSAGYPQVWDAEHETWYHPKTAWEKIQEQLSPNAQCKFILKNYVATAEMTSLERAIRRYDYIVFFKKPLNPDSELYKYCDDFLERVANEGKTVYTNPALVENSSNTTFIGAVVAVSLFSLTAIAAVLIVKKKYQE